MLWQRSKHHDAVGISKILGVIVSHHPYKWGWLVEEKQVQVSLQITTTAFSVMTSCLLNPLFFLCLCQCIQILLHVNSICGWKKNKKKLQTASVDCSSVSGVIIQLQDVQMGHITRIKWELLLTVLSILSHFFFQTHTTLAVLNRIRNRSLISCGRFRYETRVSTAASTSPAGTCLKNFKKH